MPVEALPVEALPVETLPEVGPVEELPAAFPVAELPIEALPAAQLSVEALPIEALPGEAGLVQALPVGALDQNPVLRAAPVEELPVDQLAVEVAPVDAEPSVARSVEAPIYAGPIDAPANAASAATADLGSSADPASAHRSATALVPPVPPEQVGWSAARPDRPVGGRRGGLLVALLAIVPVCLVAIFLWRSHVNGSAAKSGPTAAPARSTKAAAAGVLPSSPGVLPAQTGLDRASTSAASAWIRSNLAGSVPVAADLGTAVQLRNDGRENVTALPATADQLRFVRYLVVSDAKSAVAAPAALRQRATPVATFGRRGHAVSVEQVVALPAGETLPQLLARDHRARILAGTQLAQNPRLHTTAVTGPALRSGLLDLRAATVLAVLAGNGSVRLDSIDQIAAERSAHVPARTITITVPNASAVGTQIRALAAPYGADSSQLSPTKLTVQWPVDVAPALPVQ